MAEIWNADEAARRGLAHRGPCVIASGNGLGVVARAWEVLAGGGHPLDASVEGVRLLEDDPNDVSVGYGGLPNAEGEVELDAAVMEGPTHSVGAVAGLKRVRHAASVARDVLRHTDHSLLVGEGALAFARSRGYVEEDLLTPQARQAWEDWKREVRDGDTARGLLSDEDRWMLPDTHGAGPSVPFTTGTVHCSCRDREGRLAACTTTSGLSWKMPGRVGDSPIVGAGLYVDQAFGAAGGTGRGEAALDNCAAYAVVGHLERGLDPGEACLAVVKRIVDRTRREYLLDAKGRPTFNLTMYALRADGAFGSAAIYSGYRFAVATESGVRLCASQWLYERPGGPPPW